MIGSLRM
ncbi:hypothetical protein LINPERHAP1_LOCUS38046 [Linum perenne]